jgi:hypothetical protein
VLQKPELGGCLLEFMLPKLGGEHVALGSR